jgi:hypothetical protein
MSAVSSGNSGDSWIYGYLTAEEAAKRLRRGDY